MNQYWRRVDAWLAVFVFGMTNTTCPLVAAGNPLEVNVTVPKETMRRHTLRDSAAVRDRAPI
jgi:hypothetical protein